MRQFLTDGGLYSLGGMFFLLLFTGLFTGLVFWVFSSRQKKTYQTLSELPLKD